MAQRTSEYWAVVEVVFIGFGRTLRHTIPACEYEGPLGCIHMTLLVKHMQSFRCAEAGKLSINSVR